jgi:hypothetical protein
MACSSAASATVFVADSVDVSTLPRDYLPVVDPEYRRIPAAKILDVFTSTLVPSQENVYSGPLCPRNVDIRFDRQRAKLIDDDQPYSLVRKAGPSLSAGRINIQRTFTSSRDFTTEDPPTPGKVP